MSDFEASLLDSKRFALTVASLFMISVCVGILVITKGASWRTASIWGMGGVLCLYWLLKPKRAARTAGSIDNTPEEKTP